LLAWLADGGDKKGKLRVCNKSTALSAFNGSFGLDCLAIDGAGISEDANKYYSRSLECVHIIKSQ
jgi:hypothetical protein